MVKTDARETIYNGVSDAPVSYVNSVQVLQTTFDVRFWFGLMETADTKQVVTKVTNVVYMSPQHAKIFANVLNKHIEKYESVHGPIPMPERIAETEQEDDE